MGDVLRGVTSRRRWIGRALDGLPPLELTWVCCGVDYPQVVEGGADYLIYTGTKPWDHAPGSLLLAESGAFLGTFEGGPYRPQADRPPGWSGRPTGRRTTSCRGWWATSLWLGRDAAPDAG